MNFGSDQRVRDAFRATLQGEPSSASILGTQEIDAADVLEVTDLANAIARAEEVIRARSSRVLMNGPDSSANHEPRGEDIFDRLAAGRTAENAATNEPPTSARGDDGSNAIATDDTVGPAVHAPYRPTPLPPRTSNVPLPPGVRRSATLLRAPDDVLATPIPIAPVTPPSASPATLLPAIPPLAPLAVTETQPLSAVSVPPPPQTAPLIVGDEDAFYYPAGRIRTLADVTLDGYRPESTLMVRLRERRHTLKWIVAAIVAALALFAVFAVAVGFGRASVSDAAGKPVTASEPEPASGTTAAKPAASPAAEKLEAAPTPSAPTRPAEPAATTADLPVFDVNSLKNAPPAPRRAK